MNRHLKPYICDKCEKRGVERRFGTKGLLSRHGREVHAVAQDRRVYVCLAEGCNKDFGRKSNCKDHFERKHKEVAWNECMIKVVSKSELEQLQRVGKEVSVGGNERPCDADGDGVVQETVEMEVT